MKSLKLCVLGLLFAPAVSFAAPQTFTVDPAHVGVTFKVDHLGFSNVYGIIPAVTGSFTLDEKEESNNAIDMTIDLTTLETFVDKRDEHLKGPDFFNVKRYPKATFESTSVKKGQDNIYKVKGNLSLHGVTKEVNFDLKKFRTGKGMNGETRTGGEAIFTIERSDFNMNYMQGKNKVGDEVKLFISLEGILKDDKEDS